VFDTRPQDVKTGMSGLAKFECVASGNPQPSVYWTKEGSQELMFPDNTYGRHHVTLEGVLEIKGVRKEDAGYYVCSAFSVAGSGSTRAFLEVSDVSCVLIYYPQICSHHDTHSWPQQQQQKRNSASITELKINVVLVIKSSR
jgi:hypothetical protein